MLKKVYLVIQLFIYIIFIYLDINKQASYLIKYLGIIINFLYALILYINNKKYDFLFLVALLFTAIADYFLLVTSNHYTIGVIFFCLVQTIYGHKLTSIKSFIYRITIFISTTLILPLFNVEQSLLNICSIYSFTNLSANLYCSIIKKDTMFSIGLLLFWLCDLNVGIYNIPINSLYKLSAYLMWIFYFPSQVIITLEGEKNHEEI